jgi:hypothetical protein
MGATMKKCDHCGASNSIDSSYCYLCTRTFDRRAERAAARWQAIRGCRFCGAPNVEDAERCYHCGDPLRKPEHEELLPVRASPEKDPAAGFEAGGDPRDWRAALRAMRDQQPRPAAPQPKEKIVVQPWWQSRPQRA